MQGVTELAALPYRWPGLLVDIHRGAKLYVLAGIGTLIALGPSPMTRSDRSRRTPRHCRSTVPNAAPIATNALTSSDQFLSEGRLGQSRKVTMPETRMHAAVSATRNNGRRHQGQDRRICRRVAIRVTTTTGRASTVASVEFDDDEVFAKSVLQQVEHGAFACTQDLSIWVKNDRRGAAVYVSTSPHRDHGGDRPTLK